MQREAVARDVAGELTATETVVEDALFQAVRLMRRLIDARRELGLPVAPGEPVMGRAAAVVAALGEAQQELVRTRAEVGRVRDQIGLGGLSSDPAFIQTTELRRTA